MFAHLKVKLESFEDSIVSFYILTLRNKGKKEQEETQKKIKNQYISNRDERKMRMK